MAATYYCWCCYGEVPRPAGPCFHCGRQIAAPDNTDETARLLWGLWHPLSDRCLVSARALALGGNKRAKEILQELTLDEDPQVADAALGALALVEQMNDPAPENPDGGVACAPVRRSDEAR